MLLDILLRKNLFVMKILQVSVYDLLLTVLTTQC